MKKYLISKGFWPVFTVVGIFMILSMTFGYYGMKFIFYPSSGKRQPRADMRRAEKFDFKVVRHQKSCYLVDKEHQNLMDRLPETICNELDANFHRKNTSNNVPINLTIADLEPVNFDVHLKLVDSGDSSKGRYEISTGSSLDLSKTIGANYNRFPRNLFVIFDPNSK